MPDEQKRKEGGWGCGSWIVAILAVIVVVNICGYIADEGREETAQNRTSSLSPTARDYLATRASRPASTPTTAPSPTPAFPPTRHLEEKRHMLNLINQERAKADIPPVELGDNAAAQLHAEAMLEHCFLSHWGADGLKPYMRYSLAGGYQANGENSHGSNYCIEASDGYPRIRNTQQKIVVAMEGLMSSPGHRRQILHRWHKRVNIGLARDNYNFTAVQHFEGDYVEFDQAPEINGGILGFSGRLKNGPSLGEDFDLRVFLTYDQPPTNLTRGQLSRTNCYSYGLILASLRPPPPENQSYVQDEAPFDATRCPNPYDVVPSAPAPKSRDEANEFWERAYDASQYLADQETTIGFQDATTWQVFEHSFSVQANVSEFTKQFGEGVYTVLVLAELGGEFEPVAEYSIFYSITPPDVYTPHQWQEYTEEQ